MMIARLASRAFGPGLLLIGIGVALIGAGVVLDHYDMRRAEWYIGEAGIVLFGIGCLMALAAVLAILSGADPASKRYNGDASGNTAGPAPGGDGGADG